MMQRQQGPPEAPPTMALFADETISTRIYKRIDALTGPDAWQELSALLQRVRAIDSSLFMDLENAVLAYASQQSDAAFVVGYEAATRPVPWMFAVEE